MKMTTRSILLLLALAAALPAQVFPETALKPFISRHVKKGWRPPIPEGKTLLGLDAASVLEAIRGRCTYVETEYVRLVCTVSGMKAPGGGMYPRVRESLDMLSAVYPKFKVKSPILSRTQFAHFIAFHLERVMAESWRMFGTTKQTYLDYLKSHKTGPYMRQNGKFEAYLFASDSKCQKFADQFTGRTSMLGQRYRSPATDTLSFLVSPPSGGAKSINRWVNLTVNQMAHNLLMSEVRNSYRIPMWLDIGFAHWMEQREGFEINTYTFGEAGKKTMFVNGDWRPELRSMAATDKVLEFDTFYYEQSIDNYNGDMRGISFGIVDYMIRKHIDGFRAFCRILREKENAEVRSVFQEAFKIPPSTFFELWKDWAKENYTPQGMKELPRDPFKIFKIDKSK